MANCKDSECKRKVYNVLGKFQVSDIVNSQGTDLSTDSGVTKAVGKHAESYKNYLRQTGEDDPDNKCPADCVCGNPKKKVEWKQGPNEKENELTRDLTFTYTGKGSFEVTIKYKATFKYKGEPKLVDCECNAEARRGIKSRVSYSNK